MYLEPGILIGAFTRIVKELSEHVAKRDLFAETWLREKSAKVTGGEALRQFNWRKRATG